MTTHFITAEIDVQASPLEIQRAIVAALQERGEPLRWAITAEHPERHTVSVEAVVTVAETATVTETTSA